MPAASSTTLAWWGREYTTRPFSTVLTRFGACAFHCERRWRVLLRDPDDPDHLHIRRLAAERDVPVEIVPGLAYACIGLIKEDS